jgi:hypothetical protein
VCASAGSAGERTPRSSAPANTPSARVRSGLRVVGARGRVRDLLRADGLGEMVGGRLTTVEEVVTSVA